jgi:hypothetical protein
MRPFRTKEVIISILIDYYLEGRQPDELTELFKDFGNNFSCLDSEREVRNPEAQF